MPDLILTGELAEIAYPRLTFAAETPAEMIRALMLQFPKTRHALVDGAWAVVVDGTSISLDCLHVQGPFETVVLEPYAVAAEGKGGPVKLLVGGLLLIATLGAGAFIGAAVGTSAGGIGLSGGLAASVGGVSLGTVGKLSAITALSGLVRTLAPSPNTDFNEAEATPASYLFPATGNRTQQGARIPIAYGRTVTGSVQVSARSFVNVTTSTDSAQRPVPTNTTVYESIDIVSEGEIEDVDGGDKGVYIGAQPIESSQGGRNFPTAATISARGLPFDPIRGALTSYTARENQVGLEARFEPDVTQTEGAVEFTVTDPFVTEAGVILANPAAFAKSGQNLVATEVNAHIEFLAGDGTWVNCPGGNSFRSNTLFDLSIDGATSAWIADTTFGGALRFPFYVLFDTTGGFPANGVDYQTQVGAWVEIAYDAAGPWVRVSDYSRFTEEATDEAQPDPSYPNYVAAKFVIDVDFFEHPDAVSGSPVIFARLGSNASNLYPGGTFYTVTASNAGVTTRNPQIQLGDEAVYSTQQTFFEGRTGTFESIDNYATARGNGAQNLPREFRVIKDDEYDPATPDDLQNRVQVVTQTDIYSAPLQMPHSAGVRLRIEAADTGGQAPVRRFRVRGVKVRIPTGYDPEARTYPGVWDGTYQADPAFTDNPAWVLLDYLTNERYGMGVPDSYIDKWTLYDCAKRCDELVPADGGGTEWRYQFQHVFERASDALKAATTIAGAMDCTLFYADGKLYFSQRRPGDPVRVFGPSTVIDGRFSYTGQSVESMKNVAMMGWTDPDLPFENQVATVERPFSIERFGRKEVEIQAIGAATRGQALRNGRYELIANELEGEIVSFSLPMAEMLIVPGDVVAIQDPHRARVRLSGRVQTVAGLGQFVTFDGDIEANGAAVGWKVWVTRNDGTLYEGTLDLVSDKVGEMNPWVDPAKVEPGAAWMIAETELEQWRVISVEDQGNQEFAIQAHKVDPDLWNQVEDLADQGSRIGWVAPAAPAPPSITGGGIRSYWRNELDDDLTHEVTVAWFPGNSGVAEVTFAAPNEGVVPSSPMLTHEFPHLRFDALTPPSPSLQGAVYFWDALHISKSSGFPFAIGYRPEVPVSSPVFVDETSESDGDGLHATMRLEWSPVANADFYMVVASIDGETVEVDRWVTRQTWVRYAWNLESPAADFTLRVFARSGNSQASSVAQSSSSSVFSA